MGLTVGELQGYLPCGHGPWSRDSIMDIQDPGAMSRFALFNLHSVTENRGSCQHLKIGGCSIKQGFPGGSEVKASACNVGDLSSIPGSGRSPGEGNSNPLQWVFSCF